MYLPAMDVLLFEGFLSMLSLDRSPKLQLDYGVGF